MNERQRDLFLHQWSRRRAPGRMRIALRGAVIGALGGVVFAAIMSHGATTPGVAAHDVAGQLASAGRVFLLSVPAFALIGLVGADRVWSSQERMYQSLLASGARVPERKPVMTAADRGPAIAVGVAVAVIAGFIIYLFWAAGTGRL